MASGDQSCVLRLMVQMQHPVRLLLLLVLVASISACGELVEDEALPYYNEASFTPKWLSANDPALDTFHRIPPFKLVNQEGDTITEQTFSGKIYIVDFFFTSCPGICPRMTGNMGELQEEFMDDDDVLLLSHSVLPRMDSVAVLSRYAKRNGVIAGKWHLATGDQQEIYKLGRRDYFVEEDLGIERDLDEFLHTENFVLVDAHAHIRGIYNGLNKSSLAQLVKDVRALQRE